MSGTAKRALLAIGWLLILGLTLNAVIQDGWGLLYNWASGASSLLILTDLMVELTLISIFIYIDARRRGRNPVPWIVVTLVLGGVGSLGYLFLRTFDPGAPPIFAASTTTRPPAQTPPAQTPPAQTPAAEQPPG